MMESGIAGTTTDTTAEANGAKAAGPQLLEVLNPATGATIANLPVDGPEAVAATVARVRAAQPDWEAMGIEGRYYWLGKRRGWVLHHSQRVLHTTQEGNGQRE